MRRSLPSLLGLSALLAGCVSSNEWSLTFDTFFAERGAPGSDRVVVGAETRVGRFAANWCGGSPGCG